MRCLMLRAVRVIQVAAMSVRGSVGFRRLGQTPNRILLHDKKSVAQRRTRFQKVPTKNGKPKKMTLYSVPNAEHGNNRPPPHKVENCNLHNLVAVIIGLATIIEDGECLSEEDAHDMQHVANVLRRLSIRLNELLPHDKKPKKSHKQKGRRNPRR